MNKVTILLEDGEKIRRKVKLIQFGNFVMAVVKYKNREYLLKEWEGDEYLRPEGIREIYTLGRRLRKDEAIRFNQSV